MGVFTFIATPTISPTRFPILHPLPPRSRSNPTHSSIRTSMRSSPTSSSPPATSTPHPRPGPGQRLFRTLAATAAAAAVAGAAVNPLPSFLPTPEHGSIVPPAIAAQGGGATFSGSSQRVNKDPESLLRWGLPVNNPTVRELQTNLENITYDIRKREWNKVEDDLRRAVGLAKNKQDKMVATVSPGSVEKAEDTIATIQDKLPGVREAAAAKDADLVVERQRDVLRDVGTLESLMVKEFPYEIPKEYAALPRLLGRATVEVKIAKADGQPFDIDGTLYKDGVLRLVVDGYNAPVTAGNFVDLVNKGFYDDKVIFRSDGFVIQTGDPDPEGPLDGYIDPATKEVRTIPLEVFAAGDKEPTYGLTLEEDGRGSAQTVLPFSAYGTLAMAREEFTNNSASSQFFWFLFEPDLTPAGRNLLDGRYTVFGYTTEGSYLLKDFKAGDRVVSAKVVEGQENLSQ